MKSNLEATFAMALAAVGCDMIREYKFHPTRKWRLDFADPDTLTAVEIDGGEFSGGSHSRGVGMANDYAKRNSATEMGWAVFQITGAMCKKDPLGWARRVKAVIERRRDEDS